MAQKLVSENHLLNFQKMLSLACGIALDEAYIIDHCDINVLGVDLDNSILADAKKRETARLSFMKCDVTQPFPPTWYFDCVYSRNLLHYFNKTQQQQIVSRISSILRPGGLFVFQLKAKADYFYTNPDIENVLKPDGMIYFPSLGYSRNHLNKREVEELLTVAQFDIENLYLTTENLFDDSHKSTLINCFARKT